jgi:hypothetical protein
MKNIFVVTPCALFFLLSCSCRKGNDPIPGNSNPLTDDEQVVEYHKTWYDNKLPAPYPAHAPYLFKKTYSGKTVTEITCSFNDEEVTQDFLPKYYHVFKVAEHGLIVYLVNKQLGKDGIPDTVATVTLNAAGRPETCAANPELAPDFIAPTWILQHYYYHNDKVIAVKAEYTTPDYPYYKPTLDSLHYDDHGNLLSFMNNIFSYDYSREPKQQFYCEGFMSYQEPFYLLQYLGYFPEVNCPTNLMNRVNAMYYDDWTGPLANHQFDGKGRLISYDYPGGPTTITWK